ncbi:hypothetical protein [Streptomyces sp. NRRL S-920]|uniref:hypothetical protein n=1 Tax=Streptomyces sp. NRRL S-920 TaxID=1463921 RepID=UPI0004C804D1|nr:hypothetical protein [Streptomyces sp. NRRL S-920]
MAVQTEGWAADGTRVPAPAWIEASLKLKEGRDPLGLQTTTQDRLMPVLLPGILELTRRARYFSFHAFLLAEYRDRHLAADGNALSAFIKRREWEFGLAVLRCPRGCGSSPVGARRLSGLARGPGPYERGESVASAFGGYGLYYRSPMAEFGIVARAGTLLGGRPIPIDVLHDTDRARRPASAFKSAVEHTAYYQRVMWTTDDLPADVIDEYAHAACLCRLRELPEERAAVHAALFCTDAPTVEARSPGADENSALQGVGDGPEAIGEVFAEAGVRQRCLSVGHYLSLLDADPSVVASETAYRDGLWSPPVPRGDAHAVVAGQWAALIAKDVWQEALCSVWVEFCRAGLIRTGELGRGLTWDEVRGVAAGLATGQPDLHPTSSTTAVAAQLAAGTLAVPDADGILVDVATAPLDDLRRLTSQLDTASSGLVVLLELVRRMEGRAGDGWQKAAAIRSGWQPSIADVTAALRTHLAGSPTVADTLWWLVSRFVIPVHERIAYSKLPERTFRFRWEDGLLHFYDHGVERFPLAAVRNAPLASLTWDLDCGVRPTTIDVRQR